MKKLRLFMTFIIAFMSSCFIHAEEIRIQLDAHLYKPVKFLSLRGCFNNWNNKCHEMISNTILKDNLIDQSELNILNNLKNGTQGITYFMIDELTNKEFLVKVSGNALKNGIEGLDAIVVEDSISELEMNWRENSKKSIARIVEYAQKNKTFESEVVTFLGDKVYQIYMGIEQRDFNPSEFTKRIKGKWGWADGNSDFQLLLFKGFKQAEKLSSKDEFSDTFREIHYRELLYVENEVGELVIDKRYLLDN